MELAELEEPVFKREQSMDDASMAELGTIIFKKLDSYVGKKTELCDVWKARGEIVTLALEAKGALHEEAMAQHRLNPTLTQQQSVAKAMREPPGSVWYDIIQHSLTQRPRREAIEVMKRDANARLYLARWDHIILVNE